MPSLVDRQDKKSITVDLIEAVNLSTVDPSVANTPHPKTSSKRSSQVSTWSSRISRPLSFNGSIWLKNPEDIVPQLEFVPDTEPGSLDPRQHVFTRKQKRRLVYLVSIAAMFSPLSSNIYFPAMVSISKVRYRKEHARLTLKALHTSVELIALTVTIYMLFQGLSPSLWGPLADNYGRRPVLLCTLTVYILANLGLALSPSFATLMAFRAIQAVGSASTIAIGAGIIGDISVAAERGGFMGLFGGSESVSIVLKLI
jgi:Major Facilitator Superfamily